MTKEELLIKSKPIQLGTDEYKIEYRESANKRKMHKKMEVKSMIPERFMVTAKCSDGQTRQGFYVRYPGGIDVLYCSYSPWIIFPETVEPVVEIPLTPSAIKKTADHYGAEHQAEKFLEELFECGLALQKYKQNMAIENFNLFCEELADLLIMANQLKYLSDEKTVNYFIEMKIKRQLERIKLEVGE